MLPTRGGVPSCKNCGVELDGSEEICPECEFSPRRTAMRVATGMLIGAVTLILLAYLSLAISPRPGPYLASGGFLLFFLATVVFVLALLATPSRFGSIFKAP